MVAYYLYTLQHNFTILILINKNDKTAHVMESCLFLYSCTGWDNFKLIIESKILLMFMYYFFYIKLVACIKNNRLYKHDEWCMIMRCSFLFTCTMSESINYKKENKKKTLYQIQQNISNLNCYNYETSTP